MCACMRTHTPPTSPPTVYGLETAGSSFQDEKAAKGLLASTVTRWSQQHQDENINSRKQGEVREDRMGGFEGEVALR